MTSPTSPLGAATSALYVAVLQLEAAAEKALAEAASLTAAAQQARIAYENAAIHTDAPRCGNTHTDRWGKTYGPCARPVGHPEAYHRNVTETQLWLTKYGTS